MKNRVLLMGVLASFVMMFAALPFGDATAETSSTEVGNEQELLDGLKAPNSIILTADIDVGWFSGSRFVVEHATVLDLNGYTIKGKADIIKEHTGTGDPENANLFQNRSELTIRDSSKEGSGALMIERSAFPAAEWLFSSNVIANHAALKLEGGKISNASETGGKIVLGVDNLTSGRGGSFEMTGGHVSSNYVGIRLFNNTDLNVTVSDGIVEGGAVGIWSQSIEDRTVKTGIAISGGEISGIKNAVLVEIGPAAEVDLTISGGTFINNDASGEEMLIKLSGSERDQEDDISITQGSMVTDNDEWLCSDFEMEGCVAEFYDLSYDSNYEGDVDRCISAAGNVKVMPMSFERADHLFQEWNTMADGTGESYSTGESLDVDESTVLYAIWESTGAGIEDPGTDDDDDSGIYIAGVAVAAVAILLVAAFVIRR